MPAIPELRRLRQEDGCKFTANLGYSELSITPTMEEKEREGEEGRENGERRERKTHKDSDLMCVFL